MKCDLHVHTLYSFDSTSPPKKIVETAIKRGIDCLAITDHGEIKGAEESIEYAKGKPVLIIPGIEVKTKNGDMLGLNVRQKIPDKLPARETIKKIKEAGGMVVIPHPFGLFCSFQGELSELIKEIDAIEISNASILGNGNEKAQDFVKKYDLPFTAGSDAHSPGFLGRSYLEIPGENLSAEEILIKIKNRDCKIGGEKISLVEKVLDHLKRNISKLRIINIIN